MPQKPGDWGSARTGDDEGTELGGLGLGLDAAVVGGEGKTGKCRPSQRVQSTYPWPWIPGCTARLAKPSHNSPPARDPETMGSNAVQ